jgi:hypothetical protein
MYCSASLHAVAARQGLPSFGVPQALYIAVGERWTAENGLLTASLKIARV